MWISFCFDPSLPSMNFKPGTAVEVPDEVARRWQLTFEQFMLVADEMDRYKELSWYPETRAIPKLHAVKPQVAEPSRRAPKRKRA